MSLRDICRTFNSEKPLFKIPATPATVHVAKRLEAQLVDGVVSPPVDELDNVCQRLHEALASGVPISRKDLRRAPWCIFTTRTPIGRSPARLEQLLEEIAASARNRVFRTLAAAYMHFFDPDSVVIRIIASFLTRHIEKLGQPWTRAHDEAQFFSPLVVADNIAKRALAERRSPDAIFQETGFSRPEALAGLRKHVHFRGLERIAKGAISESETRLVVVREWAAVDGKLRYDESRARVANALLLPFGDTTPARDLRDAYLSCLLPLIGDPRTSPARWVGCETAERIVRRWLTEVALRQFLDVVDKVAQPEHWAYRRAFWAALERKGYVDDAWVVFESSGASAARRMFGKDISFATFDNYSSIQAGHSVLLLRIGSLVVVEWSHNGKCRIWDENSGKRPPRLFQHSYSASDLRKEMSQTGPTGQGVFVHHGSPSYSWQTKVAAFLKNRANIDLRSSDFILRP
jgi:hypothetical protein